MNTLITQELLNNAISYSQYRSLIDNLLEQHQTTGTDHSESMVDYTKMNVQRMNKWDKIAVVADDVKNKIAAINKKITLLIITEGWCGDASQILPVINKLCLLNSNITAKYILRDKNPKIIDLFLTNGAKAIPIIVVLDSETLSVLGHWGPRPKDAQNIVLEYKKNPTTPKEQMYAAVHAWYAKDKGVRIQQEFLAALETATKGLSN
ncbi:MAG: thioredoxin family protein [Bacteroidetes bacterium]|nr:thioredoxin family protein [Bacteroidota bacterium]